LHCSWLVLLTAPLRAHCKGQRVIPSEEDSPCRPRSRCRRTEPPRFTGEGPRHTSDATAVHGSWTGCCCARSCGPAGDPPVRCVLPTGRRSTRPTASSSARCASWTARRSTRFLRMPEIGFGEGYTDGRIEGRGRHAGR
jgi:hypothetical protein